MKTTKALAALAGTSIAALMLAGCVPAADGGTAAETTRVRVTIDTPTTFEPARAISLPDFQLARLAYDALLRRDDSGLVPGLATEWETTPTSATFTIRDNATCSDGTPITPAVVQASLESYAANGDPGGVAEAFGGSVPVFASDDAAGTVTVTVDAPWAELAQAFTVASTGIVCPAGLDAGEALGVEAVEGSGSGPYVLDSFEPGVRYVYTLRDDYDAWPEWTTELEGVAPQTIEYVVSPDPSATANMTLAGDLDLARIFPDSAPRFEGVDGVQLQEFPFGTFYLVFNERAGNPFADPALRTAVAQSLDREQFFQTTTDGMGEILNTLASSATPCVSAEPNPAIIPTDTDAAAAALAGVKIRLLGAQVVGNQGAGNVLLEEALRAAGADVTLENVDIGTWASKAFGEPNTWDLTIYPDLNFLGSLATALSKFTGPDMLDGGPNIGGTVNPTADDLLWQARASQDDAERCDLYNQSANALIGNADTVPLIVEPYIYAARDGFRVYMLGGSLDDHIFRIDG